MQDFTPAKVFKSCAFVPSDEELSKLAEDRRRKARRARLGAARHAAGSDSDSDDPMDDAPVKRKAKTFEELGVDDSDDDMPDIADIMRPAKRMKNEKGKGKGKAKQEVTTICWCDADFPLIFDFRTVR